VHLFKSAVTNHAEKLSKAIHIKGLMRLRIKRFCAVIILQRTAQIWVFRSSPQKCKRS